MILLYQIERLLAFRVQRVKYRETAGYAIGRPVNWGTNENLEKKTMNLHKGKLCRILFEATHGASATTMRSYARTIAPNEN